MISFYPNIMSNHSVEEFTRNSTKMSSMSTSLTFSISFTIVYLVIYLPICISSIFGNGLVIFAFHQNENLKKVINYPLISLAVNDFATGSIALPLHLIGRLVINPFICRESSRMIFFLPSKVLFFSSALHLFSIAIGRFISLLKPLSYPLLVSSRRVKVILAILWCIVITKFSLILIGVSQTKENMICDGGKYQSPFVLFIFILYAFILPVILVGMFSLYLFMVRIAFIQLSRRRRRRGNVRTSQLVKLRQLEARSKFRGSVTMAIIVGAFCFCWMPTSFKYMYVLFKNGNLSADAYNTLQLICEFPAFLSAILNPIIYACRKKDFRVAYCKIWKKITHSTVRGSGPGRKQHSQIRVLKVWQVDSISMRRPSILPSNVYRGKKHFNGTSIAAGSGPSNSS